MAKSTKSSSRKLAARTTAAAASGASGDLETYVRLKLLLDSFNALASRYYTGSKDSNDRTQRLKEIEKLVNSLKKLLMTDRRPIGPGNLNTGCPPGMKDCDGICIPVDDECPRIVL